MTQLPDNLQQNPPVDVVSGRRREESQISLRRAFFLVAQVSHSTFANNNEPLKILFFTNATMNIHADVGG